MIHLLWCTLRPNEFIKAHSKWRVSAKKFEDVCTYVCVNDLEAAEKIKAYFDGIKCSRVILLYTPPYFGICLPLYKLALKVSPGINDIVVLGADDFDAPLNWDEYLKNKFHDREGLLLVNDGIMEHEKNPNLIISIPIMTGGTFNRLNKIIYNPAYYHFFSDNELYRNAKELGILIDERQDDPTVFKHNHWTVGRRSMDAVDQAMHPRSPMDQVTFCKRMQMPVEERIKFPEKLPQ